GHQDRARGGLAAAVGRDESGPLVAAETPAAARREPHPVAAAAGGGRRREADRGAIGRGGETDGDIAAVGTAVMAEVPWGAAARADSRHGWVRRSAAAAARKSLRTD